LRSALGKKHGMRRGAALGCVAALAAAQPWRLGTVDDVAVSSRASPTAAAACAARAGLAPNASADRVTVVYSATLLGDPVAHGYAIALRQLAAFAAAGLLCRGCADFHVVVTAAAAPAAAEGAGAALAAAAADVAATARRLSGGTATVATVRENGFEGPALHRLWRLACARPRALFLYAHNKGATRVAEVPRGPPPADGPGATLGGNRTVWDRAGQESEIPNFKGSDLGRFPLVSADFWTSDHLSERPRSVDDFSGTRARGTLTLKRR